ncbi:MAG TPA: cytochrome c maturation protein CcmE [Anaerolineae bacterium]|nr:cytochrome c maturation protein CcmE [Anaerolineae bacterium]
MADVSWTNTNPKADILAQPQTNRLKFAIAGIFLFVAIGALLVNALQGTTQLFTTVGEYYAAPEKAVGRDMRISGYVLGDSISYTQIDATSSRLEFDIVDDVNYPDQRIRIIALNEPKPDLLQHQAQAIVEGRMEDGQFFANEGGLFLKCPTRYEELSTETGGTHPDGATKGAYDAETHQYTEVTD